MLRGGINKQTPLWTNYASFLRLFLCAYIQKSCFYKSSALIKVYLNEVTIVVRLSDSFPCSLWLGESHVVRMVMLPVDLSLYLPGQVRGKQRLSQPKHTASPGSAAGEGDALICVSSYLTINYLFSHLSHPTPSRDPLLKGSKRENVFKWAN